MSSSKGPAVAGRKPPYGTAASHVDGEVSLSSDLLEAESEHRRAIQSRQLELHYTTVQRGQWFNLIITLCGFGCCAYVAIHGHALPATGIAASSGLTGALAAFSQRKLEAITQAATEVQGKN